MQNSLNKTTIHLIKMAADQKKEKKGHQNKANMKGHIIKILKELVTTPTLCRDCKHTMNQNRQCY